MTPPPPGTTELVLDAATAVLAEDGWAGFSLAAVGRRAGLSERPVRARAPDRSRLAATVWRERLGPGAAAVVERCVGGLWILRHTGDDEALLGALADAARRSPRSDAAAEALLVARFDRPLGDAVDRSLGARLRRWTTPSDRLDPAEAARAAHVAALALGLAVAARHPRAATPGLRASLAVRAQALAADPPARELPDRSATHIDAYPVLAADDPALDLLLNTALEMVGLHGFDGVGVAQVAARAGHTEGLVFSRYATKLDMVVDATRRQNEAGWRLNEEFVTGLERDFGTGVAAAVMVREAQLPGRELGRSMALEQVRLGWHHPELAAAQVAEMDAFRAELLRRPGWDAFETEADFFVDWAYGLGTYLLAFLAPGCFALPHDVVAVPLLAAFEARRDAAPAGGAPTPGPGPGVGPARRGPGTPSPG